MAPQIYSLSMMASVCVKSLCSVFSLSFIFQCSDLGIATRYVSDSVIFQNKSSTINIEIKV